MWTDKDMIDFAKWWYGTEAETAFPGRFNISIEVGFDYWKARRAPSPNSRVAAITKIAATELERLAESTDTPPHLYMPLLKLSRQLRVAF